MGCDCVLEVVDRSRRDPIIARTGSKGRCPPNPVEAMLSIYLIQQWHDLSDLAMEDAVIKLQKTRRFRGIELVSGMIRSY